MRNKINCDSCKGRGFIQETQITYTGENLTSGEKDEDANSFWGFRHENGFHGNVSVREYLRKFPLKVLYETSKREIIKRYKICPKCKGERKMQNPYQKNKLQTKEKL